MTKLDLAKELVQQLQQQNTNNLDMIDKLQQQVQVQQTWFQWAVGIFITVAIAIAGLTWLSIRAENKRSREEIINLKKELGIDNLVKIVDEQMEKYNEIKAYTNKLEEIKKKEALGDFLLLVIDMGYVKTINPENLYNILGRITTVSSKPDADDIPSYVKEAFLERMITIWNEYKKADKAEVIKPTIEGFNGTLMLIKDKYLSGIGEDNTNKYNAICEESAEMLKELQ